MAPSKLRKAIGAVKDHTSIGLAKVNSSSSTLSDLEVSIVKATRHDEHPPDERHVIAILNLTSYSRAFVNAAVSTIARRLSKTKNWAVALKSLMLIQRLLAKRDLSYEQEIFFATRRGTRLLNMSEFRDASGRRRSWDYSAFVRTYALYLDEVLEFRMQGRREKRSGFLYHNDEASSSSSPKKTPARDMNVERIFWKVHHLMQVMDRFLACRPTGAAKENRVVNAALYPIIKESFQLFFDITEILGILIERFMQLEKPDMMKVYEIFCRVSKQYDELDSFYAFCITFGIARSSEYPEVEKISQKKLNMMEDFIHEKSALENRNSEPEPEPEESEQPYEEPEPDMNMTKALPATDFFEEEEEKPEEEEVKRPDVGDLLNLGEDAPTATDHGDMLALALFDGSEATATTSSTKTPWEAFESSEDWETALVQSASYLSNQTANLPEGFNSLVLDGMYQHGKISQANSGLVATGSASSVALGSAGRPAMLALPAPPTSSPVETDPFAASLCVAPPAYVQMSELEKKKRLMAEEDAMWREYSMDGMHGQVGLAKVQQPNGYQYNSGGYTWTY